jgi:Fic family protein
MNEMILENYTKIVDMWRKFRVASVSDIDHYLHNFRILFAYHSGKIENQDITYHDTREIFENGRALNFTGDPRCLFELENQRLCYEFLKHKIAAKEPLTIPLILEIHAVLTSGTYDETRYIQRGERPGSFKKHDYMTGLLEVGSLPENVPTDISELLAEIAGADSRSDILMTGAYFHARFEHIHPFADGNGRVGRALLNYFFMTRGHPPVIINEEDKGKYYFALECYDRDEDIAPMRDFLLTQMERTWIKTLERERRQV